MEPVQYPYVAFWRGRKIDVQAESSLKARDAAALIFKAKNGRMRPRDVVVLRADLPVSPNSLPGRKS